MNWLIFALLYPLLYAIGNVLDKHIVKNHITDHWIMSFFNGFYQFLFAILILVFIPFEMSLLVPFSILFGLGFVFAGETVLWYKAFQKVSASTFISLFYTYAIFVAIFANIFLGEVIGIFGYIGIILAVIGAGLIAQQKTGFHLPARKMVIAIALFLAISEGAIDVFIKYLTISLNVWLIFAALFLGKGAAFMLILLRSSMRKRIKQAFGNGTWIRYLTILNVLYILSAIVFIYALILAPVTLVAAMGTIQPLYVFLIASLLNLKIPGILDENLTRKIWRQKLFSILLIVGGLLLLLLL